MEKLTSKLDIGRMCSILLVATLALSWAALSAPSVAAPNQCVTGTNVCAVSITPERSTVAVGSTFDLSVVMDTGSSKLGAYSFTISFDPQIIAVDTSRGSNGATAGDDGFLTLTNPSADGRIVVNGFDINGKGPSSELEIVKIHFTALALGTSSVSIEVSTISDELGNSLGSGVGTGAQVTVSDEVTPDTEEEQDDSTEEDDTEMLVILPELIENAGNAIDAISVESTVTIMRQEELAEITRLSNQGDVTGAVQLQRKIVNLASAISQRRVAAYVNIDSTAGEARNQAVESYVPEVNVVVKNVQQRNRIDIEVSSDQSEGKTIVLNIDKDTLDIVEEDDVQVLYDNVQIDMASDYDDVLDATNDGGNAEYILVFGSDRTQVLVSVPSFSVHSISVAQLPTVPSSGTPPLWILMVVGIGIVVVMVITVWKFLAK